jgi:two-component system cell cycle sensor histidine kinase/response regulator CckA
MTGRPHATVLVVDDEPHLAALVARMLASEGYDLLTATSPVQALATSAAREGPIDLLLTDMRMPGMTGRVLATELRKTRPALRVLYLTGYSDDLFDTLTLLAPHEAFVEKPITTRAISEAVALHLYSTLVPPPHQDAACGRDETCPHSSQREWTSGGAPGQ